MKRYSAPVRPLATSAVSTADGPGRTVTGIPAAIAAATSFAPGSLTPGRPASETSATRSPASTGRGAASRAGSLPAGRAARGEAGRPRARREPRDEIDEAGRLVVLVVREERRLDAVTLEQDPGVTRVLAENEVRSGQLLEHRER